MHVGSADLTPGGRAALAMDDPVAFVTEVKEMFCDVCRILLGVSVEGFFSKYDIPTERKTRYYKATKGAFGHLVALDAVTEGHARGTLHFHLLIYGGLSPYLLQRFAAMDDICKSISVAMDQMYTSKLPIQDHIIPLLYRFDNESDKTSLRLCD